MRTSLSLVLLTFVAWTALCAGADVPTYTINSAQDWATLSADAAKATTTVFAANVVLTDDIDLSSLDDRLPMGTDRANYKCIPFSGTLDGQGHTLKGINKTDADSGWKMGAALFCRLQDAVVQNLVLDESCSFNGSQAASLSLTIAGSVTVRGFTTRARVGGSALGGGLVSTVQDTNDFSLLVEDSACEGRVTGSAMHGGLVGQIMRCDNAVVTVRRCTSRWAASRAEKTVFTGSIIGSLGGGINTTVTVQDSVCETPAASTVADLFMPGFVGYFSSNLNSTLVFENDRGTGITETSGLVNYITANNGCAIRVNNVTMSVSVANGTTASGLLGTLSQNPSVDIAINKTTVHVFGESEHTTETTWVCGFIGDMQRNPILTLTVTDSFADVTGITRGVFNMGAGVACRGIYNTDFRATVANTECHLNFKGEVLPRDGESTLISDTGNYASGFFAVAGGNNRITLNVSNSVARSTMDMINNGVYNVAGGFVGSMNNNENAAVTFTSNVNEGTVDARNGTIFAGGFVGTTTNTYNMSLTIKDCINGGAIKSNGSSIVKTGGFIGNVYSYLELNLTLVNSINNAEVSSVTQKESSAIGGFIGWYSSNGLFMRFENNTNNGAIRSSGSVQLGGMVGYINSCAPVDFSNNTNNGDITCTDHVGPLGGLVGELFNYGTTIDFRRCYNTGAISVLASQSGICGGLFGKLTHNYQVTDGPYITDCANTGAITLETAGIVTVGGVVGYMDGSAYAALVDVVNNGTISVSATGDNAVAGGLVGQGSLGEQRTLAAVNSSNHGNITVAHTRSQLGGLFGLLSYGVDALVRISGCRNTGNLSLASERTASDCCAGGLVGSALRPALLHIADSANDGAVALTVAAGRRLYAGGLVGYAENVQNTTVTACANRGAVAAAAAAMDGYAGGVVGYALVQYMGAYAVRVADAENAGAVSCAACQAAGLLSVSTLGISTVVALENAVNRAAVAGAPAYGAANLGTNATNVVSLARVTLSSSTATEQQQQQKAYSLWERMDAATSVFVENATRAPDWGAAVLFERSAADGLYRVLCDDASEETECTRVDDALNREADAHAARLARVWTPALALVVPLRVATDHPLVGVARAVPGDTLARTLARHGVADCVCLDAASDPPRALPADTVVAPGTSLRVLVRLRVAVTDATTAGSTTALVAYGTPLRAIAVLNATFADETLAVVDVRAPLVALDADTRVVASVALAVVRTLAVSLDGAPCGRVLPGTRLADVACVAAVLDGRHAVRDSATGARLVVDAATRVLADTALTAVARTHVVAALEPPQALPRGAAAAAVADALARNISAATGVAADAMHVELGVDAAARLATVDVFVDGADAAQHVADTLAALGANETCAAGVLCACSSAHVVPPEDDDSSSSSSDGDGALSAAHVLSPRLFLLLVAILASAWQWQW